MAGSHQEEHVLKQPEVLWFGPFDRSNPAGNSNGFGLAEAFRAAAYVAG